MNEDKASRYHRLRRRVSLASAAWATVFLFGLVASGASAALRTVAEDITPDSLGRSGAVAVYVAFLALLNEVGNLPLAFYGGFVLERRYGLSRQPLGSWLGDQAKALGLLLVLGCGAAVILYWLIVRYPIWWWLPAGVIFSAIVIGLANLAPILLLPLFYTLKPISREELRSRLLALAERAGTRIIDVYEWGLGEKTNRANAALTGIGASRRILVSDTMLSHYTDDEIEVVLAHELAHHVHGDIWTGLLFESGLTLGGFLAAAAVLSVTVEPFGLRGVDDVAGLPLLLLAAGAVSLVMLPVSHAVSRAHERRADQFALTLTRNPPAFISAMRRLSAQNLAEEEPSPVVQWLFHSHPPIRDRIASAQAFRI